MSNDMRYWVASFGIEAQDRQVLERIFALSTERASSYALLPEERVGEAHIMLVNTESPGAVSACKRVLGAGTRPPPLVAVSQTPPPRARFHLRRPFMATRLLGLLDQIVDQRLRSAPPPAPPPRPMAAAPAPAKKPPTPRHRALVVDDSAPVRKQIGLALEGAGINVDYADGGERALDRVDEGRYDIVFLDVVMPGMDGYTVCRSIKRDRDTKHIPVVMLTGRSSPFDKVKGKLSGCDTYLTKPVSRDEFDATLKKYLTQPILVE